VVSPRSVRKRYPSRQDFERFKLAREKDSRSREDLSGENWWDFDVKRKRNKILFGVGVRGKRANDGKKKTGWLRALENNGGGGENKPDK